MQRVHRLVKLPEPAVIVGNGNAPYVLHQESVLAIERLGVHGNPGPSVAHRLQHAQHVPSVDMVAYGHHAVGEKFTVFADFIPPLNPEAKPDAV